ncbi:MAG TPA: NADPH:quinone oxidoreductase family protein [Acidimicrobiales bacterium]|nr:NADPH:quinone oxidoreductase family protein [Acidimicrobiales bacterium]
MRAALCRSYGGPDLVEIADVPPPGLTPGTARVRVHVGAVNFPDVLVIADTYQVSAPVPFIPGSEFAGVVAEVAEGADGVAVGERVFGSVFIGAFAEEVVVGTHSLSRIPDGVDDLTAAAFGVAYKTAYHVLRSVAEVQPGDELVVLGAGGGVGSAAVQLGALMGATVTAVASSEEKLEAARACGATRLVNHRDGDLRQALRDALPKGAEVVVDPVGGDLAEPALRAVHWGGRFVTVGFASGTIPSIPLNLVLLKGVRVLGFQFRDFATHMGADMARNDAELLELLASGRARPVIGATYDLAETAEALRVVADGEAVGKVVLRVAPV